jgi:hypothetical protein
MADDLQMDRTLQVTQTDALVSIAWSLNVLSDQVAAPQQIPMLAAASSSNN